MGSPVKPVAAGTRFGRLVTTQAYPLRPATRLILCRCDCGEFKSVPIERLRAGDTRSCGCLNNEARHKNLDRRKHGELTGRRRYQTPEYRCWRSMIDRCRYG